MERVSVLDFKMGWEALRECYPLAALDNLVSTYDKWYTLYKSMRTTITVDQNNIALSSSPPSSSSLPWPTLATCQPIRRHCSSASDGGSPEGCSLYGQALSAGFADCHLTRHELVGEGCIPIPTTCRAWCRHEAQVSAHFDHSHETYPR